MPEQRKFIRYKCDGSVSLKAEGAPDIKAGLCDISFEGMAVYSDKGLAPGSVFVFSLTPIGRDSVVSGKAAVKNSVEAKGRFRIGLEFTEVDKKAVQHIISCLQQEICAQIRKRQGVERAPSHPRYF